MKFEDVNRLMKELDVKAGDFLALDVAGTVVTLKPRGGMRLGDGDDESMVAAKHVMMMELKPMHGPITVEAALRGYFEEWHSGSRAYLIISGNGVVSRVALAHIADFRLVSAPTLPV